MERAELINGWCAYGLHKGEWGPRGYGKESFKGNEILGDTGAFYTTVPPSLAKELGIRPLARTKLTLADKREVEADVSLAYIKVLEREGVFQVVLMDVPEPLLGVTTLEGLGIKVDPSTGALGYSRPYGVAILRF